MATPTDRAESFVYEAAKEWIRDHGKPETLATTGNAFLAMAERLFWKAVANTE
jgi:hypothetical protein